VTQDLVPAAAATSGADLFSDETLYDPYPLYRELRDRGAAVHMQLLDAWALPSGSRRRSCGGWSLGSAPRPRRWSTGR
jgi:hypothetical protein